MGQPFLKGLDRGMTILGSLTYEKERILTRYMLLTPAMFHGVLPVLPDHGLPELYSENRYIEIANAIVRWNDANYGGVSNILVK